MGQGGVACPKPEPRKRVKARKKRAMRATTGEIREYVFGRERLVCRCCRCRRADTMNEEPPRSCGGKISKRDSMAVCGDGTRGCHGFITRNEIRIHRGPEGSEGTLTFEARTKAAAEWMKVRVGESIESPVMAEMEAAS